ncbi:MAG: hypothetical protein RLZ97_2084 [Verrucomicrobiota bacterium]|jgi:hypothetical protein
MSLDLSRLENVRKRGDRIIARCPACAEENHDEKGEHLVMYPNGAFGCVTCPGEAGRAHRKQIIALAGDPKLRQRWGCFVRVRRPAPAKLPKFAGRVIDLVEIGTLGTTDSNPYVMKDRECVSEMEKHTDKRKTHREMSDGKPSQPSRPVPLVKRPTSPPTCGDPLMAHALKTFADWWWRAG